MQTQNKYQVAFWKPYQGKGAAAIFERSQRDNECVVFLSLMPEGENNTFNSKAKITCKLGLADFGEMLLVLRNIKNGVGPADGDRFKGLFHNNPAGSTVISFSRKDKGPGYYLQLSSKRDTEQNKLGLSISEGEGEIIRLYLEDSVRAMFVDTFKPQPQQQTAASA